MLTNMIENIDLKTRVAGISPKKVDHSILTQEQKDKFEEYINWKLKDLDWWAESGLTLSGKVEVSKMIEDNDFYLDAYTLPNETIYHVYSDCDRYRFEASIFFNEDVTKFYFNDPY